MKIQIRKLQPNESNSYRDVRLECLKDFPNNFSSNYQDEKLKTKLFFQPFIEQSATNNFVIGAFDKNTLIGISGFQRYERKKIDHRGIIIQVYVKPDFQGKSIGKKMIQSTLEEAFKIEGIEQVEINVIATNDKAANMYKNLGFKEYGFQKNYLKINGVYLDHKMLMIFKNEYIISQ